ncbi:hypothetical protein MIT9_P0500 [Methylomarinovum caldicuralii]|uniref:Methyltransferase FkbM domain-containing protein n=1 Tax=Methylomarinovum caldicuralii TaxID=438856 RepID=A0AAU9CN51_9GAMM|nr:FkbM family methyltransferase [Methylomarinovum caldicuralii]BCX80922.1 hypothetical protein MIT9_P0500 [Methylomarinovum caldicuralii]
MSGIISHAQNFEDVILWRALQQVEKGFYIDVGAQHPVVDSVSLTFYERGWRGIHVEPCPYYAELLRRERPDETVIEAAVSNSKGTLAFYEIPDTGLSTANPAIAERHRAAGHQVRETVVPTLTLADIFELVAGREIHWLKIDVEGWEKQVLESWGSAETRPWIVVVESTLPLSQVETHQYFEEQLIQRGYRFVYFDGLNRFYIHESYRELQRHFEAPPNIFDDFQLAHTTPYCGLLRTENDELATRLELAQMDCQALTKELQNIRQALAEEQANNHRLTAELDAANAQAEQARQEAHSFREELGKAQSRLQWLEAEWQAAKARIEKLTGELALSKESCRTLTEELQSTRQALAEEQTRLAEIQAHNHRLEAELNAAKTRIEELNGHAHHWHVITQEREKQLAAMYASWSWKVTAPLRFGYDVARWTVRQIGKAIRLGFAALLWLFLLPFKTLKAVLLSPLLLAMRRVLGNPVLADRINRKLLRIPWLHRKLRVLAVRYGLIEPTFPDSTEKPSLKSPDSPASNPLLSDDFIPISLRDMTIHFHKGPLADQRGIGRVSREILDLLRKKEIEYRDSSGNCGDSSNKNVYFYSSIHWCPENLPQPSVVMIHDVIPLLFPGRFPESVVDEWKTRYKNVAQQAKEIVTVSKTSAMDIARLLNIDQGKIHVIYNGVRKLPVAESVDIDIPDKPYIVYLGSYDHHKNIDIIFRSLGDPRISDVNMIMIGDNLGSKRIVAKLGLYDRVHFLGRQPDEIVAYVIKNALALVFPSLYEGFGLPPMEAALLGNT